jgi:hypothetical protein
MVLVVCIISDTHYLVMECIDFPQEPTCSTEKGYWDQGKYMNLAEKFELAILNANY